MKNLDLSLHYMSGDKIKLHDNITLAGFKGKIEFIIGSNEFSAQYLPNIEWYIQEYKKGFMVHCDEYGDVFFDTSDEDLLLISRAEF